MVGEVLQEQFGVPNLSAHQRGMKKRKLVCVKSGLWRIFQRSKTGICRGRKEVAGWEDLLTESLGAEWTSILGWLHNPSEGPSGDARQAWGWGVLTHASSSSPLQAMGIKTALPTAELGLYSLVLSGALAYAGQGLLEASQGNRGALG